MKHHWIIAVTGFALSVGWLSAQPPPDWAKLLQHPYEKAPIPDLGLQPLLIDKEGNKISTPAGWSKRRAELHKQWQTRLGTAPAKPKQLDVKTLKVEKQDGYTRKLISFHSGGGDRLEAWLLVPDGIQEGEKRPAVVVFHPTTKEMHHESVGISGRPHMALAVQLVKRGYVVLAPQCFITEVLQKYSCTP